MESRVSKKEKGRGKGVGGERLKKGEMKGVRGGTLEGGGERGWREGPGSLDGRAAGSERARV